MRYPLTSLFCVLLSAIASGQFSPERALQAFDAQYPTETIHLDYQADEFFVGECIWFKAYVALGAGPSDRSTNLYVELYDAQKARIDKYLVALYLGAGEGSFLLPETLPEGVYYIRAYTLLSLNHGRQLPYVRQLNVYNPVSPKRLQARPVQWNAASFAESGTLLAGVRTTVALRLFSRTTLPDRWTAIVTARGSGSIVASCRSFNLEVGSFSFTPLTDEDYEVKITDDKGAY
ncbi:MAG: hypothetical protein JWP27_1288, partial [Flaviaesturariibacter sp.]|nr:hypothetical protein [Flaviaesturariibacter sp.]